MEVNKCSGQVCEECVAKQAQLEVRGNKGSLNPARNSDVMIFCGRPEPLDVRCLHCRSSIHLPRHLHSTDQSATMVRNATIPNFSLRRQMLRMSWNKYNLFNLTQRTKTVNNANKTLYQQKWAAKKDTRAYHGDQITERQWQSMFKTRLPTANTKVGGVEPHPPVFSLTYAEMERRLDFIVFRSNFAPSIYAARQLVGHGKVTINGKTVSRLPERIWIVYNFYTRKLQGLQNGH